MAKKSVLHICDYAANYRGNFIESLEYLAKKQKNYGDHVYLFPYRAKSSKAAEWIADLTQNHIYAYIQEKNIFKNFLLLRKIIKKHKVSCIIRHFSDLKTDILLKICVPKIKIIRFFHGMYTESKTSLKHKLRNFIFKGNTFVGVGEAASKNLRERFNKFRILTISNAIFFDRLNRTDEFTKNDDISLMTMGYNLKVKGADLSIAAAEKINNKYHVHLYIATASHKDELVSYINNVYGYIPSWITILPPTENIATYYNNIDIFLSPSRSEAFGYAVVEAAYCEKSIVATKVDGQGELKIPGVYWCESENLQDIQDKIELAINELKTEKKQKQLAETALYVQKEYSLDNWANKVMELIYED